MIKKMYTLFMMLYPILSIYEGFIGLSLSMSIMIPILILGGLAFYRKQFKIDTRIVFLLVFYLFVVVFTSGIAVLFSANYKTSTIIFRVVLFIYHIILIKLSKDLIDIEFASRAIVYASLASCVLLWIQIVAYYLFGNIINFQIPFLNYISKQAEYIILETDYISIYRAKSLFLEPSQFSFYASYGLAVLLFIKNDLTKYKKMIIAIFITLSLFASTAATGFVLAVIIWFFYLLNYYKDKIKIKNVFLTISASIFVSVLIFNNSYFSYSIDRLFISSSRVTSFLKYFLNFDLVYKIFGCGIGNYISYVSSNFELNEISTFISGFGFVFIENGIFGFLLFTLIFIIIYKRTNPSVRVFVALFYLSNMFAVTIYNIYFVLYLMWPLLIVKRRELVSKHYNNELL